MNDIIPVKRKYIIGTRGSLLALTQCGQIKDQLEELTGDSFELKVIKTQGDQIQDKPLWQLEGKDFFTKELDEQLINGDIDMVVHSYKDLGSERPAPIKLAAITKRSYAADILLIKKETLADLKNKTELIVGTSSPRRIVNIEKNLSEYIPYGSQIKVKTKVLRGNVNTRITKLRDGGYDAIVLALAGIERLAITESSKKELEPLLEDMDFMVLPQSTFPSAASQGALGIECLKERDDNGELLQKLELLKDKNTISEVQRERQAFNSYGGGCHLAVGINVMKVGDYYLHVHRGSVDDKEVADKLLEGSFPSTDKKDLAFLGMPGTDEDKKFLRCSLLEKKPLCVNSLPKGDTLVATSYGIENVKHAQGAIFSAGTRTWKNLAKSGYWVNASADALGEAYLENLRQSKTIEMMLGAARPLNILTNEDSYSKLGTVIPNYQKEEKQLSKEQVEDLKKCDVFYWTSFSQYKSYINLIPTIKDKFHCCGLGKTLDQFMENGISARPFGSIQEFRNWIKE